MIVNGRKIFILLTFLIIVFLSAGCDVEKNQSPIQQTGLAETKNEGISTSPTGSVPVLEIKSYQHTIEPSPENPIVTPTQQFNAEVELASADSNTICSPITEIPLLELPEIVSAPYNPPPMGKDDRHQGVDFSFYRRGDLISIDGLTIQSVFDGRVAGSIEDSFPYGNFIIIETTLENLPEEIAEKLGIDEGQSLYVLYAHMTDAPIVSVSQELSSCTYLGTVGVSGNAGIPHLHLEVRIGQRGQSFEGMAYYSTQTSELERINYEIWRMSGNFVHIDPMRIFTQLEE